MNCKCGKPVYVNEKGFAGEKPFVAKFCAECLSGMFADLFEEAVEYSVQADGANACPHCGQFEEVIVCWKCGGSKPPRR